MLKPRILMLPIARCSDYNILKSAWDHPSSASNSALAAEEFGHRVARSPGALLTNSNHRRYRHRSSQLAAKLSRFLT